MAIPIERHDRPGIRSLIRLADTWPRHAADRSPPQPLRASPVPWPRAPLPGARVDLVLRSAKRFRGRHAIARMVRAVMGGALLPPGRLAWMQLPTGTLGQHAI